MVVDEAVLVVDVVIIVVVVVLAVVESCRFPTPWFAVVHCAGKLAEQ